MKLFKKKKEDVVEEKVLVAPKYSIGDVVFYLEKDKILSKKITCVALVDSSRFCNAGKQIYQYGVSVNKEGYPIHGVYFSESKLFTSKEEVINDLIANN